MNHGTRNMHLCKLGYTVVGHFGAQGVANPQSSCNHDKKLATAAGHPAPTHPPNFNLGRKGQGTLLTPDSCSVGGIRGVGELPINSNHQARGPVVERDNDYCRYFASTQKMQRPPDCACGHVFSPVGNHDCPICESPVRPDDMQSHNTCPHAQSGLRRNGNTCPHGPRQVTA